jgi:hypothetical protein
MIAALARMLEARGGVAQRMESPLAAIVRPFRRAPGEAPATRELGAPPPAGAVRFEFKMVTSDFMVPDIRSWLRIHPIGLKVAYPPRWINSVYFDSPRLENYEENLAGIARRRKARLRWYGEAEGAVTVAFEVKCKRGRIGWKLAQPIATPIDLSARWSSLRETLRAELKPDLRLYFDGAGEPVLMNRYLREYYSTFDGVLRVTLDYHQRYFDQRFSTRPNLRSPLPEPADAIIEFKAPPEAGDRLAEAVGIFPLRVTRGSKYVRGVETLLGYDLFDF